MTVGLTNQVLDEEVAGQVQKSYQYSPWGERLSQVKTNTDGSKETSYYGYDQHTNVEALTDDSGNTKATYGYTAYGDSDNAQFTGIDKPDAGDPTKEPYNAYRFNAKRWDSASGSYDMGFRTYDPGLNRFLTRDSYNGALADMRLGTNPWTGNRYAFAGGNPITGIELDGHCWDWIQDACDWVSTNSDQLSSAAGHAAEVGLGLLMVEGGADIMAGGVGMCATGVLCLAGAPALVAGGLLTYAGAKVAVDGAVGLGQDISQMHSSSGGSSSGGGSSGPTLRTPKTGSTDGGPGQWKPINCGGSDASKAYQENATGVTRGNEYSVNGVDFDGYQNGKLLEAKDDYSDFIDPKTGDWKYWWKLPKKGGRPSGYDSLVKEARSQQAAAGNTPLEWRVSTPELKAALERTFVNEGINIPVVVFP